MSMVSRRRVLCSLGVLGAGVGLGFAGLSRSDSPVKLSQTRFMMGTFVSVTARNESRTLLEMGMEHAFDKMTRAETIFTRHDSGSPLGVLNTQGELRDAPRLLTALLSVSLHLAGQTRGAFNPTTPPVLAALHSHGVSSVADLPKTVRKDLVALTDPTAVNVRSNSIRLAHSGMGVSLDGIAKGHIVDLASAELLKRGVSDFLINAGGDIRVGPATSKGWSVGIQDGSNLANNIEVLRLDSGAMATSGNYESLNAKGYNHIVSPDVGDVPSPLSVTVKAPTCAEADSLATTLFAMGMNRGMEFIDRRPSAACVWQMENGLVPSRNWMG